MTLANNLQTAYVNNTSWEDMAKLVRDQFTEELYKDAEGLFDPDTIIKPEENEYQRGIVELIMSFTGQNSDDKEAIAAKITEALSTAHLLTAADFGTGINGDLLYIGPFTEAETFIRANDNTVTVNRNIMTGLWRVELADGNSFGVADTPEMAWRYALAAEFGPIDDEFQPFRLK